MKNFDIICENPNRKNQFLPMKVIKQSDRDIEDILEPLAQKLKNISINFSQTIQRYSKLKNRGLDYGIFQQILGSEQYGKKEVWREHVPKK